MRDMNVKHVFNLFSKTRACRTCTLLVTKKIISNQKELEALLNPKDRLLNVMGCITELDGLLKPM
jgi:hypothetical protein